MLRKILNGIGVFLLIAFLVNMDFFKKYGLEWYVISLSLVLCAISLIMKLVEDKKQGVLRFKTFIPLMVCLCIVLIIYLYSRYQLV